MVESYAEPLLTSKMELFAKTVNGCLWTRKFNVSFGKPSS